ncbi:hypothetical protein KAR91_69905 [Candidatus Pacearchaeota archaeon]|nr:hypothetical protein [Candidatus Pacearchaeota archaeon]
MILEQSLSFVFTCSECNNILNVVVKSSNEDVRGDGHYATVISVKPCKVCHEKGQKPLKLLREMMKGMEEK